ncbi:FAD-binding oxidoreductase [Spirochaetota bacterium]
MERYDDPLTLELRNIVGNRWVSADPEIIHAYCRDINLFPINLDSVIRPPFYVVLPGTDEEVQKVMAIAKKFKAPITIQVTGLNITGMCVPPRGGILLDLKRMDKLIDIDETNCTVTVQPYVSIARVSCELQKRGMYIPVPGAPSTVSLMSNFFVGLGLKVTNRIGRQDQSIMGYKLIKPNGDIVKVGSGADPLTQKDFWPHGPGPDLHMLPVYSIGTVGIVTELTIKCWLRGDHYKELWISYENIDDAISAFQEIARMEIGKGLNLYGGNKYSSYFTDRREAIERMIRANPEFQLIMSFEGTRRTVEYEEGVVRDIAKKTKGIILTDKFPPYKSFVESHLGMSGSFYSDFSMRYWGSRGTNWTTAGFPTPDRLPDQYRAYSQAIMDDPEYGDPDFGHAEYWRSIIAYPFEGGHYHFAEHGIDVHPGDKKWQNLAKRVGATFPRYGMMRKLLMLPYNRIPREGYKSTGPIYGLAKKIVKKLDPHSSLHPGVLYRQE